MIPLGIVADAADLPVGEVLADGAGVHRSLGIENGGGEGLGLVLGQAQHVKGQPLRRLAADARQPGKLLGEPLQCGGKGAHLREARPD